MASVRRRRPWKFPWWPPCRWGLLAAHVPCTCLNCCKLPNTTVRLLMWFPYEHFNTCQWHVRRGPYPRGPIHVIRTNTAYIRYHALTRTQNAHCAHERRQLGRHRWHASSRVERPRAPTNFGPATFFSPRPRSRGRLLTARRARPPVKIAASVVLKYAVAMRRHARLSPGVHWNFVGHRRARQDAAADGDSQCARAPEATRRSRERLGGHMPAKEDTTRPHASSPLEVALVAFERTWTRWPSRAEILFKVL